MSAIVAKLSSGEVFILCGLAIVCTAVVLCSAFAAFGRAGKPSDSVPAVRGAEPGPALADDQGS